jgi:predicted acylesterase/phospholipase RssA
VGWHRPIRHGALDGAGRIHARPAESVERRNGFGRRSSGLFCPRVPSAWLQPPGSLEATSYYDTAPLKATLERPVDFERINAGETRFSIGAVNVTTGNFLCFDNTTHTVGAEHVMASGALPPGFPAVEIEGEFYWDGGLVSNTPLQWVLESEPRRDTLAFQVNLWSTRGTLPRTVLEVMTRQKEIQYSSRTRNNSDRFKYTQRLRNALASLLQKLPGELRESPELAILKPHTQAKAYNLIQLVYRAKQYEGDSKDYEFSRLSMEDHWRRQGGGSIIYMGSVHSKEASLLKAPYVTTKHGLIGLAKMVAKEGAKHGVRANVICPGFVRTPLVDKQIPEQAQKLGITEDAVIKNIMLKDTVDGEFTTVRDVAEAALLFASFESNALTGQPLIVSHGWFMQRRCGMNRGYLF